MSVDPNNSVPIYLQIADHIRSAIAAGVYRPGEMLPSQRVLALELTVNPNTVQRAYEKLEREGLIHARKGLGMFVSGRGAVAAQHLSEDSIRRKFAEGIRSAQQAGLSIRKTRSVFEQALREVNREAKKSK